MKRPINVKRRRYKVVNLPTWMTVRKGWEFMWEETIATYQEIPPVFNRDGWYLDRQTGQTWLEAYGRAWVEKGGREYFQQELEQSEGNNVMHPDVYAALTVVVRAGYGDAKLRHQHWIETFRRQLRSTYVTSALACERMLGRLKKRKAELEAKRANIHT